MWLFVKVVQSQRSRFDILNAILTLSSVKICFYQIAEKTIIIPIVWKVFGSKMRCKNKQASSKLMEHQ